MSAPDAWVDRQGDVWTLGPDGLMHTFETVSFTREHVEKKWGPLRPVAPLPVAPRPAATDEWCACDRAGGQIHPYRTNLAVHEGRSCPETRVVPPRPAANMTDVLAAHQRTVMLGGPCLCGEWPPPARDVPWTAHVAAALAEAGIGPVAVAHHRGLAQGWREGVLHCEPDGLNSDPNPYAEKADPIRPAHDGHGPLRCHDGCPAYASFMAEMHDQMRPAAPDAPRPAANVTDVVREAVRSVYHRHDNHAPLNHVNTVEWVEAVTAALAEAGIVPVAERLCSQCGERMSVMLKIGTEDGWCSPCLDEAADMVTTAYHDNIVNEAQREIHRLEGAVAEAERRGAEWDMRGGALWLDREQWGVIIDALIQHRQASEKRKAAEPDRMTDARADLCAAIIQRINEADALNPLAAERAEKPTST